MKVQNPSQHQQSLSDRIDQFFAEVSNKVSLFGAVLSYDF